MNETCLTARKQPSLWAPPSHLHPPSARAWFLPPLPSLADWMAQMLLDRTVPPVPFPSLIAQHEVSNLFSDDCISLQENFSLVLGTHGAKEEGDGEKKRREDLPTPLSRQDKQHIWLTRRKGESAGGDEGGGGAAVGASEDEGRRVAPPGVLVLHLGRQMQSEPPRRAGTSSEVKKPG